MAFRFLIVDDERLSRRYLRAMVAEFVPAATISEADSNDAALALFNSEKTDVILLDIMMPAGDGLSLLDRLPHRDFELVFVTAYNQFAIDALRQGAADYLLKPVRKSDFRKVIEKVVARRREKLDHAAYVRELEAANAQRTVSNDAVADRDDPVRSIHATQILTEDDWVAFRSQFERVHPGFLLRLRNSYPALTQAEIRLLALSKLRLTTREMAGMLGVSPETIRQTRWRLKKKLAPSDERDLDELVSAL